MRLIMGGHWAHVRRQKVNQSINSVTDLIGGKVNKSLELRVSLISLSPSTFLCTFPFLPQPTALIVLDISEKQRKCL
jgi:hypothetical protein